MFQDTVQEWVQGIFAKPHKDLQVPNNQYINPSSAEKMTQYIPE